MKINQINILDVNIADINIPLFVDLVLNDKIKNNSCISASGAHGLIESKKHKYFKNILNSFKYNLPDGKPLVWLGRLNGAKKIKRCFGPDLFIETIKKTANTEITHFFCGGKDGVAEILKNNCNELYNNNNIIGTYCPPFKIFDKQDLINISSRINNKKQDILWLGISTPKQEKLAIDLIKYINVKMIITIGAAFDYHTGTLKYAPKIIQESGFEWLYRLILEPKRLWKRYLDIIPKFLYYSALNLIKLFLSKIS